MRRLKTSVAAWSALIAVTLFWFANMFVSADYMTEISSSLVLGVAFAVLVRWFRDAAQAMRYGRAGADFLIVAVFSIVGIIFFQRVWVMLLRYHERPDWMVNSPISAFVAWMMAWSCTLALVAPDIDNGHIPPRSRILIGFALFVAGMVSGGSIMLALKP
ncbi:MULTISPECIES: hypothetical protein [Rhizobium/Agrobacterium group]|uniref:Uncharacterized protein n=2 Tax=Agrobacterium TaxID=357 RepID=A0A1S7TYE0_9HYPH|nr:MULTISPECIES: hypothetical protein [Rhizobium/Agrobacterium group]YP_008130178.1 hypothetical protein RHXG_00031 [Rhizobium phage RR1-A]AGN34407.1 hypothetical protein RHXG_00031 [Rhizobium phage RR1-A]MCZ7909409.1 hypothetical protein [Agrobacterium leguminum]WFS67919.1 hypothetical protein CFBP4996_18010 [Agrobacterium leguminum]CAD7058682.1 hypothetical protein RP007_02687 [Rhizobium sp. P007]CVI59586.1 conserved membrane hypothetical protein [Agrobacterium deltaense NCPPB 1641]